MIWFGLGLIALIVELFTLTFYLLVVALSFFITGILDWLFIINLENQIVIAAILTIIGFITIFRFNLKKKKNERPNNNDNLDLNHIVIISGEDRNGYLSVNYRGAVWQATLDIGQYDIKSIKGEKARIIGHSGNILNIKLVD